ncbi:Mitogen-activated protein kinase kinase kinase 1 [Bulinus truncatus]|nr:Mitogen-activated protein kinase kinase kinase 1 [Bulinus truncatus]
MAQKMVLYEIQLRKLNGIDKPTNWKRGECIGTGAFGKVFKASIKTRQRGNIFLAVKEVGILLQQDKSKYEESVKKETEALKKLSHERIIKYFGFHATNESFFIFIELLEMGSLEKFINAKYDSGEHIDERHAGILTKQIIEGVVYLNENNLFHRDIKSANILMSDENNVKLADFGLTREFAEMTKTYTKGVGTNRFMAPEMIALKPDGSCYNYDKSVDIWAIGCIVIHMLTGKLPFSKLTDVQVVFKLGQPDPSPANEILSKVSESCRRFFKKTLARDPKARETAVLLLNDSFVKGEELPEFETDAGKEAPEGQIDEFDVRGDNWNLEQADVSNITESRIEEFDVRNDVKPYQSSTTNNDQ